jgi:hypothetical protein
LIDRQAQEQRTKERKHSNSKFLTNKNHLVSCRLGKFNLFKQFAMNDIEVNVNRDKKKRALSFLFEFASKLRLLVSIYLKAYHSQQ